MLSVISLTDQVTGMGNFLSRYPLAADWTIVGLKDYVVPPSGVDILKIYCTFSHRVKNNNSEHLHLSSVSFPQCIATLLRSLEVYWCRKIHSYTKIQTVHPVQQRQYQFP